MKSETIKSRLLVILLVLFINITESPVLGSEISETRQVKNREIDQFVERCLSKLRSKFGNPYEPIKQVKIYYVDSVFCKCGRLSKPGEFYIQLTKRPKKVITQPGLVFGALAHECVHLNNYNLNDPYIEGLCCLFAEDILKEENKDWQEYQKMIRSGAFMFYSLAYGMMLELRDVVGEADLNLITKFGEEDEKHDKQYETQRHVNINRWLLSLNEAKREKARSIILDYYPLLKKTADPNWRHQFDLPKLVKPVSKSQS